MQCGYENFGNVFWGWKIISHCLEVVGIFKSFFRLQKCFWCGIEHMGILHGRPCNFHP